MSKNVPRREGSAVVTFRLPDGREYAGAGATIAEAARQLAEQLGAGPETRWRLTPAGAGEVARMRARERLGLTGAGR